MLRVCSKYATTPDSTGIQLQKSFQHGDGGIRGDCVVQRRHADKIMLGSANSSLRCFSRSLGLRALSCSPGFLLSFGFSRLLLREKFLAC